MEISKQEIIDGLQKYEIPEDLANAIWTVIYGESEVVETYYTKTQLLSNIYYEYTTKGMFKHKQSERVLIDALLQQRTISEMALYKLLKKFALSCKSLDVVGNIKLKNLLQQYEYIRTSRVENASYLVADIVNLEKRKKQLQKEIKTTKQYQATEVCKDCPTYIQYDRYITLNEVKQAQKELKTEQQKNKELRKQLNTKLEEVEQLQQALKQKEEKLDRIFQALVTSPEEMFKEWLREPKIQYLIQLRNTLKEHEPDVYTTLMDMIMVLGYKLKDLEDFDSIKRTCTKWKKQLPNRYLQPEPAKISKTVMEIYRNVYNRDIDPDIFAQVCLLNEYNMVDDYIDRILAEVEDD